MKHAVVVAALSLALTACGYKPGPEVKDTKEAITAIVKGLNTYKKDIGTNPPTLAALIEKPKPTAPEAKKWKGPYLKDIPKDGWGRDFIYNKPGRAGLAFDLISYGEDGKQGGKDDAQDLANDSKSLPTPKK